MNYILSVLLLVFGMSSTMLFDFNSSSSMKNWKVVNDGVMGGLSKGSFVLNAEGHAEFKGRVSLDNNGGFTSIRYDFDKMNIDKKTMIKIRLKGDGKDYQFRIRANSRDYYSYITTFSTSGKWQDIEIKLADLYPSYRGRKLDLPNFSSSYMEGITFLIANKKAEDFKLVLDEISLN